MNGSSGSVRAVLLGLVLERPGYGYELANRLVERLGETWQVAPKDIYRLLEELKEEELLYVHEQRRPGRKQARYVYSPTPLTPRALSEWMQTLSPKEPMREVIHAKVVMAREQDAQPLLFDLKGYERQCLKLLRLAPQLQLSAWSGLVLDCSRDAVDAQLRAEVEWSRRTRRRIGEYLARRES